MVQGRVRMQPVRQARQTFPVLCNPESVLEIHVLDRTKVHIAQLGHPAQQFQPMPQIQFQPSSVVLGDGREGRGVVVAHQGQVLELLETGELVQNSFLDLGPREC